MANRLAREKSPYLLQHASNPVDWFPWGDEAFAAAAREDKPLLVSIGYATCHWCHVMERESFENAETARVMNDALVCVKVDREERPDVDKVFMTAVQAMTGGGGWPLNIFLTPEGEPFFGGTYFPPDGQGNRPGWSALVRRVGEAWRNPSSRREILRQSGDLTAGLKRYLSSPSSEGESSLVALAARAWVSALDEFRGAYDAEAGGFSPAPKFPMPVYQHFLFRAWEFARRDADLKPGAEAARDMALTTLRRLSEGGIRDHLGGGFARYSTDGRWHVPHFEKMLYDNAQLAANYIDAFQVTGDDSFAGVARETLDYVLRDMAHPDGGFFSAEDADSFPEPGAAAKEEGAFYVWEKGEIDRVLGSTAPLFAAVYDVKEEGNVREDPRGEFSGKNVLHRVLTGKEASIRFGMTEEEVGAALQESRRTLFQVRSRRPRPFLDDKIITAWNGLMISVLARGGKALGSPRYVEAAVQSARFLKNRLLVDGALFRRWRDGEASVPAMADDHAFLAQGLVDLAEASGDVQWLLWGRELMDRFRELFFDPSSGAVFMTAARQDPRLALRPADDGDNVEPAAASAAVWTLLRLSRFFDHAPTREAGEKIISAHAESLAGRPRQFPVMASALFAAVKTPGQIVVAGAPGDARTEGLWKEISRRFLPGALLVAADGGVNQSKLAEALPFLKSAGLVDGRPAAYVCRDFICRRPTTDPAELGRELDAP